jgi:plastocyanin
MKKSITILSALAVLSSLQLASAGDLTGKVSLKGTPPVEMALRLDETCGKMHPDGETTHRYVVAKDGGLGNVFVYVSKGLEGKKFPVPTETPELNQKGCMYEPYMIGAMVGQTVKIKNSDPVLHNVHALPRAEGNTEFNFGQPNVGMTDETTFTKKITTKEVLVKIKCDVHDWMLAYVGVMDHPFFAVTDKDGNYKIKGLPAGEYTVTAYHLKTHGANAGVTQTVKVEGDAKADFTVEVAAAK